MERVSFWPHTCFKFSFLLSLKQLGGYQLISEDLQFFTLGVGCAGQFDPIYSSFEEYNRYFFCKKYTLNA